MSTNTNYTFVIQPKRSLWDVNLKELWQYRDLLMLLVKRDFISVYKQTAQESATGTTKIALYV